MKSKLANAFGESQGGPDEILKMAALQMGYGAKLQKAVSGCVAEAKKTAVNLSGMLGDADEILKDGAAYLFAQKALERAPVRVETDRNII